MSCDNSLRFSALVSWSWSFFVCHPAKGPTGFRRVHASLALWESPDITTA